MRLFQRGIKILKCPHYFEYAACMEMFRSKIFKYLICFTPGCPQAREGVRFTEYDVKIDEAMTKVQRYSEEVKKTITRKYFMC